MRDERTGQRIRTAIVALTSVLLATARPAAAATYFPPTFARPSIACDYQAGQKEPIVSDFERKWYSKHLQAAREPSLFEVSDELRRRGMSVLRFTWLPSFHHPVTVRIYWSASLPPRLSAKQLSGAGGYDPGKILRQVDRHLTAKEVVSLRALLARTRVFSQSPRICDLGSDGAQWLLEGVDRTGYRFVARWTPQRGAVREVGLAALKLTGWRFEMVY